LQSIYDKDKSHDPDFINYLTDIEKINMENLSEKLNEINNLNNIFFIQNDPFAKNYDFGIIKFIEQKNL